MKPCTKRRFKDHEAADTRIAEIMQEEDGNHKPVRAYLCNKCDGWHLTSLDEQQYRDKIVLPRTDKQKARAKDNYTRRDGVKHNKKSQNLREHQKVKKFKY
jgi:hypothetical protein